MLCWGDCDGVGGGCVGVTVLCGRGGLCWCDCVGGGEAVMG